MKAKRFTVTDGKLVLHLEVAAEGGYCVTSPFNSELVTEADSVEESFENAYDAIRELDAAGKLLEARSRKRVKKVRA